MKQEDKDILIKDLCARLPYGIKVLYDNQIFEIQYIEAMYEELKLLDNEKYTLPIEDVKPYLLPLSSMTEEEKKEYYNLCIEEEREEIEFGEWITRVYYHNTIESIDWLNKNHFDYRGLIPKGLAIDATEGERMYN